VISRFRNQEYSHERSLTDESYLQDYFYRDTKDTEDISELYHENSKLDQGLYERLEATGQGLSGDMDGIVALVDPDYPDLPRVNLPDPPELTAGFADVFESRRSAEAFEPDSFDREHLSQCLYYAVGRKRSDEVSRMYPSPGALYPIEIFPVLIRVDGCQPGLYYYNNSGHYLREMRTFQDTTILLDSIGEFMETNAIVPRIEDANILFVIGADFWRSKFKYGPRGYRYVLQESGHVAQNLVTTITAMNTSGRPLAAFYDRKINEFVGLDGVNEAVIYTVAAGHSPKKENE